MANENRDLTIHEKLKVVMQVQEYLCLTPETYRQLLLHIMKTHLAQQKGQREQDESNAA